MRDTLEKARSKAGYRSSSEQLRQRGLLIEGEKKKNNNLESGAISS